MANTFKKIVKKVKNGLKGAGKHLKNFGSAVVSHVKAFGEWCADGARYWIKEWIGIEDPAKSNTTEEKTLPSIRGASNSSQDGKPFPMVIGKSLYTPCYIGNPYTLLDGNDGENQFYYALFLLGYNDIEATNFKLEEVDIASNSAKVSSGEITIDSASPKFKNGGCKLEIQTSEECSLYNAKVIQESLGFELLNADGNPLIARRFSASYPMKCELEFNLAGLYNTANDDGAVKSESVSIAIGYSLDGGTTWKAFNAITQTGDTKISSKVGTINTGDETGNVRICTLTAAKQKEIRLVASQSFTYSEAVSTLNNVVQFRIWRTETKSTDTRYVDSISLATIRTWCYDREKSLEQGKLVADVPMIEEKRKLTTRLAVKIKASDDLTDTLNKINCIVQSKCRTWNGSQWSTTKTATSNPAAVALEIMTSKMLGNYAYKDSQIDLQSFGEFYNFCESHTIVKNGSEVKAPFAVGGVLTKEKKLKDLINLILSTGRSYLTMNGNKYSVMTDKPQTLPVTILNNHKILTSGASNTKSFDEIPDVYVVSFVNEQINYENDTITVYADGVDRTRTDLKKEKLDLTFVTAPNLAWSIARYKLAKQKLRPESWVRDVGIDGFLINVGNLVAIQDDTINVGIGDGGEIKELIYDDSQNYILGFRIEGGIQFSDKSKTYGVQIEQKLGVDSSVKADRFRNEALKITEEKLFTEFYFKNKILNSGIVPSVGDICSFGVFNSETVDCLCISKADNGDGTFSLGLVPYQEGVYTADKAEIPEFNSRMTSSSIITAFPVVEKTYATITDLNNAQKVIQGKTETPSTPSVRAKAEKDGIKIYCTPYGKALADTAKGYKVILYKGDSDETGTELSSNSSEFMYSFVRSADGYLEADTLSTWKVKAKTVNIYENESEYSVSVSVDVSDYGTWLFSAPSTIEANAVKDGINVKWTPAVPSNFYGSLSYNVSIKYNGTERANISTATKTASYTFKRSADGYPEKKSVYDALTDEEKEALTKTASLGLYTVEIEAVDSVTKVSKTSESVNLDDTDYETWFTPSMDSVSLVPSKDSLNARWSVGSTATYGDIRYKVTLLYNGETLQTASQAVGNTADYVFDRDSDKDGYPEKTTVLDSLTQLGYETKGRDISLYSVKVEAYTLQVKGYTSALTKKCSVQGYGTWLPNTNNVLTVNATQSGLSCEITTNPLTTEYGLPYSYEWGIKKGENAEWESFISDSAVYEYAFNEEYPEADDLLKWQVRARPLSIAGLTSLYYKTAAPDVTSYGTWKLNKPEVATRVSDRTITLIMSQPAMSAEQYGNVRYRIKIRKPSSDGTGEWFKPARTLDPYADEDNYKDGDGYIETGNVYTQTMPLTGQTNKSLCDTLYQFAVTAVNEAGVSETNDTVFETALCTNIQDIVKANETAKSAYISKLSAISANIGTIRQGTLSGNDYNYWNLSTFMDEDTKKKHWQGAMRVGGEDQYLLVKPRIKNEEIQGYDITFKVGNFEISSSASNINGELVIMESADSLDRTRISPKGTFYEHRETKDSEWNVISQMTTTGILTNVLISDRSLVVTNMSVQDRRKIGHDIGRAYLSDSSRVWHFDTDLNDQNQETDLVIKKNGDISLVDSETEGNIDFTPAILAVAPYSEIAKSLFGQYEITKTVASTAKSANVLTVDFWLQYIWCENQILFDVGTTNDKIRLVVQENEIYFNTPEEGEVVWNTDQETSGDVIVWNEPAEESSMVSHYSASNPSPDSNNYAILTSKGINLESNKWLHVGIVFSADSVAVYLDKAKIEFTRYEKASDAVEIVLNKNGDTLGNTFILDELFIDSSTAEDFESFAKNTDARVPWGKLDYTSKHFVLDADGLQTNILDDLLKRVSVLESK